MNKTHANHLEAWDSFEFWFSLPQGGAFSHSDSYCEMTISAQLRGLKTCHTPTPDPESNPASPPQVADDDVP